MEGARMGGNGLEGEEERRGEGGRTLRAWRERVRMGKGKIVKGKGEKRRNKYIKDKIK